MAYGLTKCINFVASSSQRATKETPTGFPTGSAARTIEGWVKYGGTGEQYWCATGTDAGSQGTFSCSLDASGVCRLRLNGGNISWPASSAANGSWHHIAISHAGGSVSDTNTKCYIDGVSAGTGTVAGTATVNTVNGRVRISGSEASGTPTNYWDERVSLVRVWTVARTSSEISTNACSVLGSTTNLVAEYTLDNVYTDNSGNGNDLTAVNTPTFVTDTPSTCAAVGPTTVKTVDGVTLATQLKTLDAVALASIKSINGNT